MQTASLFYKTQRNPDPDMPKLNIHCKQQDFRRAGRAWPKGDTVIDSTDYSAEQIAALKADTVMFTVTPVKAGGEAPAQAASLTDALVDAIAQLDPNNPDHFTKSGKPEIKALEAAAGINLDAKLRDQAFKKFKAQG